MSFLVMPSERESGEILGGGDWANEYAYKNPNTGKWEYTRSPRTYGPNGNMTYEEWMKSLGREPGTYGASASDYLYNQWLKSVTPKNTGRMNGMGEYIVGTGPAESTKISSADIASPVSSSEASKQVSSNEENKGTDYSWLTEATEQVIPENKVAKKEDSKNKEDEYNTFGITKEPSKKEATEQVIPENKVAKKEDSKNKEDEYNTFGITKEPSKKEEDEYNWVTDTSNENKVANKPANKINDISNAIRNIGKDAEKENEKLAKANPEATEEFDIGKKIGKKSAADYEKDYTDAIEKYGKDSIQALKAQAKLSAYLSSLTAIGEAAIPNAEDYLSMKSFEPGKRVNKKIGNYTYTVENIGKNKEGDTEFAVVIDDNKTGTTFAFKAKGDETISKDSLAEARSEIVNMVDRSMIATGLKEAPAPVETTPEPVTETPKAPVPETPKAPVPETKEEISTKLEEVVKETVDKITPAEEEKPVRTIKEIKEEYAKIDVSTITNSEEAIECKDKIKELNAEGVTSLNRDFITIYKELVNKGIKAKDIYNQPEIAKYSQDAFEFGQDGYEKYCELEAITDELGLTADKLNKKYINKHLDEISLKVAQLDPENTKITGSYYSPGSDMNGTSIQPTGINLSKEQVKALDDYANDIQCGKDANLSLMKSAAFNGAKNVKGGKYTEEWKKSIALEKGNFKEGAKEFAKDQGKLTWKDYFAAAVKGTIGTVVTILGVAVAPTNPVLGTLLITAGTTSAGKAGLQITTDVVRSKSTNEEMMFGSGEGGKDVFRDIYNRTLEPANIGDPRSVGTYTNLGSGAVNIATGFVELLENPVIGVTTIKEGVEDINRIGNGGLRGNLGNGINNIYDLGVDISTFLDRADLRPEELGLTKTLPTFIPNVKDKRIWNGDYTVYEEDTENKATDAAASEYGSAVSSEDVSEEEQEALDSTYSGAKEQAKNSNLATDYNAGMEQDVNEAVSDKYVKVFKIMIDKEPDYIRKVLIAIPKNHCEREW